MFKRMTTDVGRYHIVMKEITEITEITGMTGTDVIVVYLIGNDQGNVKQTVAGVSISKTMTQEDRTTV
jgi:hypothetical protein